MNNDFRPSVGIWFLVLAAATFAWASQGLRDTVAGESSTSAAAGKETLGTITELRIDTGRDRADAVDLHGADDRQQLIVSATFDDGSERDLTRAVQFEVTPPGIVEVDQTGMVKPLANGDVMVHAHVPDGPSTDVRLTVRQFGEMLPVDFGNEIVPIFTKLGCNGGGCHGKSGGQNGFRLSLLGFEPTEDYEHLVLEARGRRLFPAAPESSLLLRKATGKVPHGGGTRLETDSPSYRLLVRWIELGMPPLDPNAPKVTQIDVTPKLRVMRPESEQQLIVVAHYSDGTMNDVTRSVQFEPNDTELAEVSKTGLVTTKDQTGNVAIMARYQGQVGVFRATIPLGAPLDEFPEPRNVVDKFVFKQLQLLGLPMSPLCDDATFLRRSCLDLAGRTPTVEEVEQFLADPDVEKRDKWIDHLLDSGDYADFFANKWSMVLRNRRQNNDDRHGSYAFHDWIRDSLRTNKPYDQFVREIVAAAGEVSDNPPVIWYRDVDQTAEQVEDLAQLFLGMRIKCAQCHHHPFEIWSQDDYYSLAAFFSRVGRKPGRQPRETRVYHRPGVATAQNPKTKQGLKPHGLGASPVAIDPDSDPRQALVDWMAAPDNPFFARALVNRYWKHFFNRGLVEPEDDMRVTNPASNPELLDALAARFVQSGFDMNELLRTICRSRVYQLSAEPNEYNAKDKQNFSRFYPRRLPAEVLLDAVDELTGGVSSFDGMPKGTRAVQLPDSGFNSYFLTVFGRPEASTACECERSGEGNLAQSLHLINSPDIQSKLSSDTGRAAQLSADKNRTHTDKIRELYLRAYSREPRADESAAALAYLQEREGSREAYEDLVWVLINTKEFLFNH